MALQSTVIRLLCAVSDYSHARRCTLNRCQAAEFGRYIKGWRRAWIVVHGKSGAPNVFNANGSPIARL